MLKRTLFATAAAFLSLLVSASLLATAQNRLPQVIAAGSARVAIADSVSRQVKLSTDLGAANPNQVLSLSLRFNMTPAKTMALQQLLADQQNPSSPLYHRWLTPQQFGAEFGIGDADLQTASHWLQAQGFTVTAIANGRSFIGFSGTVAQAEQAFGTSIHRLTFNGEQHLANVTPAALPTALAAVATGITGLNDFRVLPRVHPHTIVASPDLATAKYDGTAAGYGNLLAPGDFYAIYDETKLLTPSTGTAIDGSGITIAVMGQVDVASSDISSFRAASGLSTTNLPTQVSEGSTPAAPTPAECAATSPPSSCGDYYESSLDLEWAGASAPGASILFVTGLDVFANAMTQAIDQNVAPILSVSYGACEQSFNTGVPNTQTLDALFMQANAQGQTVVGPAGDTGATDCDGGLGATSATLGLAVDYPASSPYVTAVGGTQFDDANGTYWNANDGPNGGSAIGYIPEQPWNEFFQASSTGIGIAGLGNGAAGGGVSSLYAKPYWQQGAGVPADASRDVPDIAYAAASNHDGYLFCSLGSCSNSGFGSASGYQVAGGTSFATPIFAGTLALVEQKIAGNIGNANPTIYGLANSTYLDTVFHTKDAGGSNAAPCTPGTIDCSAGFPNYYDGAALACPANSCTGSVGVPAIGYLAAYGYVYDTASGWGSVDVANLVADWSLAAPILATVPSTEVASTVTVSASSPSITAGSILNVSAVVASAVQGTNATPTGSATLLVDGVVQGSPVNLSNGSAAFTYTTTVAAVSGTHTVSVSYAGDAVYAGSIGAASVSITAAPGQGEDFSLTPPTSSVTVASGATTAPITYTVTSINNFSGSVAFSASTYSSTLNSDAVASFSLTTVPVTATTPGTTAFTLYAYYNANTGLFKRGNAKRMGAPGVAGGSPLHAPWALVGSGMALAGLLLLRLPRRGRNRWSALLIAVVSVAMLSVAGCTGANSSTGGGSTGSNGNINVPAGTYTITITASGITSSGVQFSHSAPITLTVQ